MRKILLFFFFFLMISISVNALYWDFHNSDSLGCSTDLDGGSEYTSFNCTNFLIDSILGSDLGVEDVSEYVTLIYNVPYSYSGIKYSSIYLSADNRAFRINRTEVYLCFNTDCILYAQNYSNVIGTDCTSGAANLFTNLSILRNDKINFNKVKVLLYPVKQSSCSVHNTFDTRGFNLTLSNELKVTNNTYPSFNVSNILNIQCLKEGESNLVDFPISTYDKEDDSIKYFGSWDSDFMNTFTVDDFSVTPYSLTSNGWATNFSIPCNYSTENMINSNYDYKGLRLNSNCSGIGIIKYLADYTLDNDFDLYLDTWTYLNDSVKIEILNGFNEKLFGLKLATYTPGYLDSYTNLSYLNSAGNYIDFDTSYYNGIFTVRFMINSSNNKVGICINGLDENSYTGCNYFTAQNLMGNTQNISAKILITPQYNFNWKQYETDYVWISNIYYVDNGEIPWINYTEGDYFQKFFEEEGDYLLKVYYTDSAHTDYKIKEYPVNVFGECRTINNSINASDLTIPKTFVDTIGEDKFNNVFFIFLFISVIFFLVTTQNLPLSLTFSGALFVFLSLIFSAGLIFTTSAWIIFGIGVAYLFANAL